MIHNTYFKCCVNCVKKTQSIAVLKLVRDMRAVATVLQRINLRKQQNLHSQNFSHYWLKKGKIILFKAK